MESYRSVTATYGMRSSGNALIGDASCWRSAAVHGNVKARKRWASRGEAENREAVQELREARDA